MSDWSGLVGKTGEEAKAIILQEDSTLNVDIMPQDSMMTMDYRQDRVRIMVDDHGIVVSEPHKG